MKRALALCLLGLVATQAVGIRGQSLLQFDPILLTGRQAPGLEPALVDDIGAYVDIFNNDPFGGGPGIGGAGGIGVVAQVGGDGRPSTRDGSSSAVWRFHGGALTLVASAGDPAPGAEPLHFNGFPAISASTPADHDDGVAFAASATETGSFEKFGLWSSRAGTLRKLLLEGEPLPGIPPGATMFSQFAFVARGSSVVVEGRWCIEGGCAFYDEGLFRDATGALRPVVIRGMPAPGVPGAVFDDPRATARSGPVDRWNASERGRVIFNGYVHGSKITSKSNEGVWMETDGGLVLLAREGAGVPDKKGWRWGSAGGAHAFGDFTVMGTPHLTSNGLALWGASITHSKYDRVGGVWSTRTGAIKQIVQTTPQFGITGEAPLTLATEAPGFAAGTRVSQVFSGRINAAGEVYLDTDVVHESDPFTPTAAIYRLAPGSAALQLLAHIGGAVPGIPGAAFTQIDLGRLFEAGDYLWTARARDSGGGERRVAFLTASNGMTSPVLRTGDVLDVSGNGTDRRQVADFAAARDPRGGGAVVRHVFEVHFTDGSAGVFTASLSP